jgi:hypothetical protein
MSTDEGSELYAVIRGVYERHRDQPSINPTWLATEAMVSIEFDRTMHDLGWIGCHLQFRQIARSFCRRHFDPTEAVETDLFPETLQDRYPLQVQAPGEEPQYVLLNLLNEADARFNIARLRKEAEAKLRHADALEIWASRKFGRAA